MSKRYRILAGSHQETINGELKNYQHNRQTGVGDVFESNSDLCKKFNRKGYPPKFEEVPRSTPLFQQPALYQEDADADTPDSFASVVDSTRNAMLENLESMPLEELRKFAEAEEIDLGNAKTKAEVIKAIRGEMVPA